MKQGWKITSFDSKRALQSKYESGGLRRLQTAPAPGTGKNGSSSPATGYQGHPFEKSFKMPPMKPMAPRLPEVFHGWLAKPSPNSRRLQDTKGTKDTKDTKDNKDTKDK